MSQPSYRRREAPSRTVCTPSSSSLLPGGSEWASKTVISSDLIASLRLASFGLGQRRGAYLGGDPDHQTRLQRLQEMKRRKGLWGSADANMGVFHEREWGGAGVDMVGYGMGVDSIR